MYISIFQIVHRNFLELSTAGIYTRQHIFDFRRAKGMGTEKKNSPNVESRLRAARAVRFLGRVA